MSLFTEWFSNYFSNCVTMQPKNKFGYKVSPHIFLKKNCRDLTFGASFCIFTFFLFSDSRLYLLNGFDCPQTFQTSDIRRNVSQKFAWARYQNATSVYICDTPIWRTQNSINIWNLLWLSMFTISKTFTSATQVQFFLLASGW